MALRPTPSVTCPDYTFLVSTGLQVTIRNTQKNSAQFFNVPNASQAAEFDRDQAAPCWPGVAAPLSCAGRHLLHRSPWNCFALWIGATGHLRSARFLDGVGRRVALAYVRWWTLPEWIERRDCAHMSARPHFVGTLEPRDFH